MNAIQLEIRREFGEWVIVQSIEKESSCYNSPCADAAQKLEYD